MRIARTHIARTAVLLRPLTRLADGSCMSVMTMSVTPMSVVPMSVTTWGPNFQLEAGLNRKTRV